jgi:hypothetical protein
VQFLIEYDRRAGLPEHLVKATLIAGSEVGEKMKPPKSDRNKEKTRKAKPWGSDRVKIKTLRRAEP